MDTDALAGQVIKLSLRDLKKFDGKRENLANFVALKQTLMMIGKAKEVNPVTEPTRAGNDAAKKANATMLDLLELYLEDQALTIFRSLKGSLTNNGYLEMKHVISGLNKWYERGRADRVADARAMLLSRRLAGMDDFEQYIGDLLAAHKTFMELEARIDERETIETICRGLLGSRFESIAEKYLVDEDKSHLSALFSDLQERYDRVKDTNSTHRGQLRF